MRASSKFPDPVSEAKQALEKSYDLLRQSARTMFWISAAVVQPGYPLAAACLGQSQLVETSSPKETLQGQSI